MEKQCKDCFDTGCKCGGIGLSCHGCCNCKSGRRAKIDRIQALAEMTIIIKWLRKARIKIV